MKSNATAKDTTWVTGVVSKMAVAILFSALCMVASTDLALAKRLDLVPPHFTELKMQADGWKACIAWCDSKYSLEKQQQVCQMKCDRHWGH